jgi:8-oxo-dGTP diphosphatase
MILVTCAVIMQENKFLCAQRSQLMKHPLKWEFPGGKLEKGESLNSCVVREVREELNLIISVHRMLTKTFYDYGDGHRVCLYPFICYVVKDSMALLEHNEVRWLDKNELFSLDWVKADLPIVEEISRLY